MSLLPDNAAFEELVQDCFLAHRGAGLMLSPLDVELVMKWAQAKVPIEVVARGIRKAAERALWDARPGEPALRSLRGCRKEVDAEIKKYLARAVGAHQPAEEGQEAALPSSFQEARHKKLRTALAKVGRERPELSAIVGRLLETALAEVPPDLRGADRQEDLVIAALLRARPFGERLRLYGEAAALAGEEPSSSAHARMLSRRFHRHAVVRRALELPAFW